MEELYSSVAPEEQRDGIAKVAGLFGGPRSGPLPSQVAPETKKPAELSF